MKEKLVQWTILQLAKLYTTTYNNNQVSQDTRLIGWCSSLFHQTLWRVYFSSFYRLFCTEPATKMMRILQKILFLLCSMSGLLGLSTLLSSQFYLNIFTFTQVEWRLDPICWYVALNQFVIGRNGAFRDSEGLKWVYSCM